MLDLPTTPQPSAQVMVHDLRANLARYLEQVAGGASIQIMSRGRVVAELRPPARPGTRPNTRGALRGLISVPPGSEDTPDDIIDLMEGADS